MEAPRAVVAVQGVVVPADDLDRPARVALQEEDHVADRRGLVVVPVGDERVDDEVALRVGAASTSRRRRATRRGPRGCPVPGCRRRRRGRRWRRRRRCGRRRAPACTRRSWRARLRRRRRTSGRAHGQKPMSTIGWSNGYTLTARSAGQQPLVRQAGEEAVDGALEVRDVALHRFRQAHVLEAPRVQALLLPRQVREVLRGDRRPARVVGLPPLGRCRRLAARRLRRTG